MLQPYYKLRILALHGYAQSQDIFKSKLGSLRKAFKRKADFTFISAPHRVSMKDNFGEDVSDPQADVYGWWFSTNDGIFKVVESNELVGFEESLKLVEETFEKHGPFDGILGFSQGAAFASILCSMQQQKLLPFKFDFAIFISGFKSLCQPHAKYYTEKVDLLSLHVYGTNDKVIKTEMSKDLVDLFKDAKAIVHEGGHYIPSPKKYYELFIDEVIRRKYPEDAI